ncbi:uncharacterized protein LOC135673376 isoform X1 [Musa acuminata AAA Group]|uniref:uncharacterized protein LOC103984296 isoform X1 n=2 Tax=Musa acuminata AAA Group TaxID=214697 RepID=UPI0031E3C77E
MAYLSRASPGRGRRLSELLEEQQEPFLMDVYLVEKGYSERLFTSQATSLCWPITACKRLKSLQGHGFRRRRSCRPSKCMLTKLLNGKAIRKALSWNKKKKIKKAFRLSDTGSKEKAMSGGRAVGDLDGALRRRCMQVDDSKQLSSVSVLELHSQGGSQVHTSDKEEDASTSNLDSPRKDLDIFRELLELAYTSAWDQLTKSKKQLDQHCEQDDERVVDSHECFARETAESEVHETDNSWQTQKEVVSSLTQLTCSDISNARREWYEFQPQVREIGTQVEQAIFEDNIEDVILEMMCLHYRTLEEVNYKYSSFKKALLSAFDMSASQQS